jgi:ankyrin repeat protein
MRPVVGRYTALMDATAMHRADLVSTLLAHGADPNLRKGNEETALMLALRKGASGPGSSMTPSKQHRVALDVAAVLLSHHADPRAIGPHGETAEGIAANNKWFDIVALLRK